MELIYPRKCFYHEECENICLSLCTTCDNPYRCKYHTPRRPCTTTDDILVWMWENDICAFHFSLDYYGCDGCPRECACNMVLLARDLIMRGVY